MKASEAIQDAAARRGRRRIVGDEGLTVREFMATAVMQGLIAGRVSTSERLARLAAETADELLEALEATK